MKIIDHEVDVNTIHYHKDMSHRLDWNSSLQSDRNLKTMMSDFNLNRTSEPRAESHFNVRMTETSERTQSISKISNYEQFKCKLPDHISRLYNFVFMKRWPEIKKFDSK
jgi:hypothetical protein